MALQVLSPFNCTPIDIFPNIFKYGSIYLDNLALVCRVWRDVADCQTLRDMIRPDGIMDIEALKKAYPYILDAGKEHLLPRRAYRDFAEKGGWLFFDPGKVKVKCEDGTVLEVALESLEIRSKLFKDPINPKPGFTEISWKPIITEKRNQESPRWVWVDTKLLGFGKSYEQQLEMALEEDKKAYPENYTANPEKAAKQIVHLASVNDLAQGAFFASVILKNRTFFNETGNKIHVRAKDTFIVDGEKMRIVMSFPLPQLEVHYGNSTGIRTHGFLCVRKSYDLN